MNQIKTSKKDYILTILVSILWGFNFVFAKAALEHFGPFTMLSVRFFIVGLMLYPFYPKLPVKFSKLLLLTFTFVVLHLGTMFWSLKAGLNASIGIVALQMQTPFLLIIGIFAFNEKIGWKSAFGILTAIFGLTLLIDTPNSIDHPYAFIVMLLSAFFVAIYSAQLKTIKKVNPISLIVWINILGFPMMGLASYIFEDNQIEMLLNAKLDIYLSLAYTIIASSIIAHSLWAYLVANNPVSNVAPITLLVPVIGVFAGVLILNEELTINIIMGALLMIIGVGIITVRRTKILSNR